MPLKRPSMKPNKIIIDADIARSAGTAEHPISSSSRKTLEILKTNGSVMFVMCPKLREEWKKHKSRYATSWLTSMVAKKRVDFLETAPRPVVMNEISNFLSEKEIEVGEKDSHLINAAIEQSSSIASNDTTARAAFKKGGKTFKNLQSIIWLVPLSMIAELEVIYSESSLPPQSCYLK